MRFIKLGFISVIILFIIALLMGLLLPSKVVVSRATDISGSADSIKPYIANLNNWYQWLPFQDTALQVKTENGILLLGKTKVQALANNDTSFVTKWSSGTNNMIATFTIISHNSNLHTLHWQMVENVGWLPWQRLGTMMNDKILGPSMEQGLTNIKNKVEQQQ